MHPNVNNSIKPHIFLDGTDSAAQCSLSHGLQPYGLQPVELLQLVLSSVLSLAYSLAGMSKEI